MELFQYKLSACCILVFGRQLSFEVDHQSTYHNCPLFWCISEFCSCLLVIHEADDVCSIKNSWDKTLSWNRHCSEKLCQYGWDLINNVTLPFWHPSSSLLKAGGSLQCWTVASSTCCRRAANTDRMAKSEYWLCAVIVMWSDFIRSPLNQGLGWNIIKTLRRHWDLLLRYIFSILEVKVWKLNCATKKKSLF